MPEYFYEPSNQYSNDFYDIKLRQTSEPTDVGVFIARADNRSNAHQIVEKANIGLYANDYIERAETNLRMANDEKEQIRDINFRLWHALDQIHAETKKSATTGNQMGSNQGVNNQMPVGQVLVDQTAIAAITKILNDLAVSLDP